MTYLPSKYIKNNLKSQHGSSVGSASLLPHDDGQDLEDQSLKFFHTQIWQIRLNESIKIKIMVGDKT